MPGNIAQAVAVGVLPQSLCTAFVESRSFPILYNNEYHDDTMQRGLITDGINAPQSLRTWKLAKKLTAAQWSTLRTFWDAHLAGLIPFYFYNPIEPAPGQQVGSNYDATGSSIQGRHACVFRGDWAEVTGLARTELSIELAEIA